MSTFFILCVHIYGCVCVFQIRISILHLRFYSQWCNEFSQLFEKFLLLFFFASHIFFSYIPNQISAKKRIVQHFVCTFTPKSSEGINAIPTIRKSTAVFDSYVVDVWYSFSADTFFFLHRTCDTCTSRLHTWLLTLC